MPQQYRIVPIQIASHPPDRHEFPRHHTAAIPTGLSPSVELGLLEVVLGKRLQQPEGEEHVGGDIKVPIRKAVMVCWLLRLVDES